MYREGTQILYQQQFIGIFIDCDQDRSLHDSAEVHVLNRTFFLPSASEEVFDNLIYFEEMSCPAEHDMLPHQLWQGPEALHFPIHQFNDINIFINTKVVHATEVFIIHRALKKTLAGKNVMVMVDVDQLSENDHPNTLLLATRGLECQVREVNGRPLPVALDPSPDYGWCDVYNLWCNFSENFVLKLPRHEDFRDSHLAELNHTLMRALEYDLVGYHRAKKDVVKFAKSWMEHELAERLRGYDQLIAQTKDDLIRSIEHIGEQSHVFEPFYLDFDTTNFVYAAVNEYMEDRD